MWLTSYYSLHSTILSYWYSSKCKVLDRADTPIPNSCHSSSFFKSEAMLGIVEIDEKSRKKRILIPSKTLWKVILWHKTFVPALGP